MTASLLSAAVSELPDGLAIGTWKQTKMCRVAPIVRGRAPLYVQLTSLSDEPETWVPCEPSVFGGTGLEERKGIMFRTSEQVVKDIKELETWAYSKMRDLHPNLDVVWKSVIRDSDTPCFKAKIWTGGRMPCRYVDEEGKRCEAPERWGGVTVIPILSVSAYYQPTAAGLVFEVQAIRILGSLKEREFTWS